LLVIVGPEDRLVIADLRYLVCSFSLLSYFIAYLLYMNLILDLQGKQSGIRAYCNRLIK
jgi:hypothetical protein